MRKLLSALALAAAMLMPLNSHAQLKFGVKGGVDITNMSLSGELLKADNRAGFFVGPTLKVMVAKPIALDMAILYNDRSVKLSQNYEDATPADLSDLTETPFDIAETTVKQRSVDVPVNVRLSLGLVYLAAGPQISFNIGDDIDLGSTDWYRRTLRPKDSAFSVNLGGGLILGPLELAATYNIACGRTADITFSDLKTTVADEVKLYSSKLNAWQISATIYF